MLWWDEFILILPDARRDITFERAERTSELAKRLRLQFDGQSLVGATFSMGVAVFPEHGQTSTGILRVPMRRCTALNRLVAIASLWLDSYRMKKGTIGLGLCLFQTIHRYYEGSLS